MIYSGKELVKINTKLIDAEISREARKRIKVSSDSSKELQVSGVSNYKIRHLWNRRNNSIDCFLKLVAKRIIEYAFRRGVDEIIIGYNVNWCQDG